MMLRRLAAQLAKWESLGSREGKGPAATHRATSHSLALLLELLLPLFVLRGAASATCAATVSFTRKAAAERAPWHPTHTAQEQQHIGHQTECHEGSEQRGYDTEVCEGRDDGAGGEGAEQAANSGDAMLKPGAGYSC